MTVSRINTQMFNPAGSAGVRPASGLADQFLAALTEASARTSLDGNAQTPLGDRGGQALIDIPSTPRRDLTASADDAADDRADEVADDDEFDAAEEYDDYWDIADGEPPADGEVVTVEAALPHPDDAPDDLTADDPAADDQGEVLGPDALVALVDAPVQPTAEDVVLTANAGMSVVSAPDGSAGAPVGAPVPNPTDPAAAGTDPLAGAGEAPVPEPVGPAENLAEGADAVTDATSRPATQAGALTAATGGATAQVQVQDRGVTTTAPTTATTTVTTQAVAADGQQGETFQQSADQDGTSDQQPQPEDGLSRVRAQVQAQAEAQTQAPGNPAAAGASEDNAAAMLQQAQANPSPPKTFAATLMAAQGEASGGNAAGIPTTTTAQPVAGLGAAAGQSGAATLGTLASAPPARTANPALAQDVMDQVKVQIAKHGAGGDTIKVQLRPVELGAIEVKLSVAKDGSVSGVVTADNKDTLALLRNDSRSLEKALSDAGFKTDQGSLEFSLRGDGNQNQTAQNDGGWRRSRRSRSFDSGTLEAMQGVDGVAAQGRSQDSARSGVDIQV